MFFKINLTETAQQTVIIEADSIEEAEALAADDSNWEEFEYAGPPEITINSIEEFNAPEQAPF